jgi:transposase-like protein
MRIKRTAEEWARIFEQQKESGQTVPIFCRELGIHPNVFYRKQKQHQHQEVERSFIKVNTSGLVRHAAETIRIGKIKIDVRETISDDFLTRLIRCALEANDVVVSR